MSYLQFKIGIEYFKNDDAIMVFIFFFLIITLWLYVLKSNIIVR